MQFSKFKLVYIATVVLLAVTTTLIVSGFATEKQTTLTYRYDEDTRSEIGQPGNWTNVSADPSPEECEGDDIPCMVQFLSSEYASINEFLQENSTPEEIQASGTVIAEKTEVTQ